MKPLYRTTLALLAAAGGGLILGSSAFAAQPRLMAAGELLRADAGPSAVAPSAPLYSNLGTDAGAFLLNGNLNASGTRYTAMVCNRVTLSQPGPQQITAFSVVLRNENAAAFTPTSASVLFYDDSGANGAPGVRLLNKAGIYYGGGNFTTGAMPAQSPFRLNSAPAGYTAAYVPAPTASYVPKVWACAMFTGTNAQATQLANLGLQKYTNAPTVGSTEDLAFVSTVGMATPVDNPAGTMSAGTGAANVFGWELTTLGNTTLLDSYQVKAADGSVGTAGFALNPGVGVEKNFSGYAATIDVPPVPAGKWNVTGMVLYPSCAVANYTSVQATIQLWDTFNGSAAPDVFGNTTPIASTTVDLGAFNCTSATTVYQFPVRLPTPMSIGRSGQLGITVKYAADSGSGFVDGAFMEVIQNAPAAAPQIAVGANASTGNTGWYKSASNRADLNFNGATDYVTGTRQHTTLRVFADMTAPTRVVTASISGPGTGTVSPSGASTVFEGAKVTYKLTPAAGNHVVTVTGTCGGTLSGSTFTTAPVTADCTVNAIFAPGVGTNGLYQSPAMNHVLLNNTNGSTLNFVSGAWDDTGPSGGPWDLNFWGSGNALRAWTVATYANKLVGSPFSVLQPGDIVDSSSTYSATGNTVSPAAAWLAGTDAYIGFQFACNGRLANPVAGVCYGYAHLTTTGPNGFPATLVDYVYDGDGNPVTVGAIVRTLTSSVGTGSGLVDPLGTKTVTNGGTFTYTLYPNAGFHVGTIGGSCPAGTLTGNSYTTGAITADCTVVANFVADLAAPTIAKAFAPASVAVNVNSVATVTLTNPNATAITLSADLVDTLPAGLVASAATTTCTGGTASFTAGSFTLASGATIPASGSCKLTGTMKAATAGSYVNTIAAGALQTNAGANAAAASATLTVTAAAFPAPYCNRTFADGREPITRVKISDINNTSPATTTGALSLENFTAIVGQLAPGGVYSMAVEGNSDGNFPNVYRVYFDWNRDNTFSEDASERYEVGTITNSTGTDGKQAVANIKVPVTALGQTRMRVVKKYSTAGSACGGDDSSGTSFGQAEDYTVNVDPANPLPPAIPTLSKAFAPTNADVAQTTTLTLSLGQINATAASMTLTADLVDTFPTGMTIAATPNASTTCPSGTLTAVAGAGSVTLATGAKIPPAGCTVKVNVKAASAGIYVNTIAANSLKTDGGNVAAAVTANYQATQAGVVNYSVGFEAPDYTVGNLNGQQTWFGSVAADWKVATINPAVGAQAVRGTWTTAGSGTSYMLSPTQPNGTTDYSVASAKLAITVAGTGATWDFAPQDPGAGSVITRVRFLKGAGNKIQALDPDAPGADPVSGYVDIPGATWTGGGAYFDLKVIAKRSDSTYKVCLNGAQIYASTGFAGNIANVAIIGNKGAGTQNNFLDVDNVVIDNTNDGACAAAATHVVTPSVGTPSGTITPATAQTVNHGATTSFTLAAASGFHIDTVGGTCGGALAGNVYTTAAVNADCTVIANFAANAATFTVTPSVGSGTGTISPSTPQTVNGGATTSFTLAAGAGFHNGTVGGTCGGTLAGNVYTTAAVTANCTVIANFAADIGNGIYNSAVFDHGVVANTNGTSLNVVTAAFDDTGPSSTGTPWDLNFWASSGSLRLWPVGTYQAKFVISGTTAAVLAPGAVVGPSSTFSATGTTVTPAAAWLAGADAYLGFQFKCDGRLANPVTGVCYGYVRLKTTAPNGFPATVVSYSYDGDGQPITIVQGTGDVAPTVAKSFTPANVAVSTNSVATITLTNANPTAATLTADLVDTLPTGLVASSAATTCTGTASFTAGTLKLASGAKIPASGSCTITGNVQSATAGSYVNTIAAAALKTDKGNNANPASATLVVGTVNNLVCASPNHNLVATFDGSSINWITGVIDDVGNQIHWNPYDSGPPTGLSFFWPTAGNGGGVGSATAYSVLAPGAVIGPSSTFIKLTSQAATATWRAGADGYMGFNLNCPAGTCYGYAHLTTTAGSGFPAVLKDYCYDKSGAPITIIGGTTFTVTPSVGTPSGTISPNTPQTVNSGATTNFTLNAAAGFAIDTVGGTCGGSLAGNVFTTNAVTANCTVIANFKVATGDPVAAITPAALAITAPQNGAASKPLNIANTGGGSLTYAITESAAPTGQVAYRALDANSMKFGGPVSAGKLSQDPNAGNGAAGRPFTLDATMISQMADNTPGDEGVSCGQTGVSTSDNSWWRRFYFSEHAAVGASAAITGVTVSGGSIAVPGGLPVTINLYTIAHSTPVDTIPTSGLTLIGTKAGVINGALQSVTIPVTGTVSDTVGKDLVVEYHTDGSTAGQFFPGANATAETHPTFISSTGCGIAQPTKASGIGFPDFHLTMVVNVDDGGTPPPVGCQNPSDIPWLSASPTSGAVAGGANTNVTVSANPGSMAPGTYTANVCVATNDAAHALTAVPVTLTVTPDSGGDPNVVCQNDINVTIPRDIEGMYFDWARNVHSTTEFSGFDFDPYEGGTGGNLLFFWGGTASPNNGGVAASATGPYLLLAEGAVIGPSSTFSQAANGAANETAAFLAGVDGYLGFKFQNEVTSAVNYGYARLQTTAGSGFPAKVVSYCYNKAGAQITIGPVVPVTTPGVAKAFAPASVAVSANSTATITLSNPNATAATLTADLVDTLPAGLVATSATTTCTGGTASFTAGTLKLASGAKIPASGSCTLSGVVSSATAGSYVNTIAAGALKTDAGNNASAASATLQVGAPFPAPYCSVAFSNAVEPITRVNGMGIDNTSSAALNGSPALENFLSVIGTMSPGNSYPLAVEGNTDGNFSTQIKAYIDWNQDGVFDVASEGYLIGTLVNSTGTDGKQVTATIPVPATALPGSTRMRVIKKFGATSNPDPCNTSGTGFGQAEDYTITVGTSTGGPIAVVTPAAGFDFTVDAGSTGTDALLIGNVGESNLTYSIAESTVAKLNPPSYKNNPASKYAPGTFESSATLTAGRSLGHNGFGRPLVLDATMISQMADNTPGDEGVSCGQTGVSTSDNSWWRRFYFSEHAAVGASAAITGVTVSGGSIAVPGGLPVTINLYTLAHSTPVDTIPTSGLTLIGTKAGVINGALQSVTIPVTGTVSDTVGKDLVVEYHTDGSTAGQFFPGANATAETHPTFLSSTGCGIAQPTKASGIGFPDFHLTMVVNVEGGGGGSGCQNPSDVPWLSATPASGTVAPGSTGNVAVTVNAGTLEAGSYSANLCVTTNDPAQALITVPVHVTVESAIADAIFCSGFEAGEDGSCGGTPPPPPGDIVVSGPLNHAIQNNIDGTSVNWITGDIQDADVEGYHLNPYNNSIQLTFWWNTGAPDIAGVSANANTSDFLVLQSGAVVGPSSVWSTTNNPGPAAWATTANGYLGFRFNCSSLPSPPASGICYGYAHLKTTAPTGFPATLLDYAYDKSGAAITIP